MISNLKIKILSTLLMALCTIVPSIAFDINDYSDFSSRSVIMNKMEQKEFITQEQKDLLKSKKLIPSTSCLIEQIKKGNIENVELLLNSKVDPNISYMSEYPIYIAAKGNKTEIAKLLLSKGAKLDKGFYSELYEAVRNKNAQLSQILLDNNAKVNYSDAITNNTILYLALKNNMTDIAIQLIDRGARLDIKTAKLIKKKKMLDLIEK